MVSGGDEAAAEVGMLSNVTIEIDEADGSVWLRGRYAGMRVTVGAWPENGMATVQESWSDVENDEPTKYVADNVWAGILADAQNRIDIWSA